MTYLDKALEAGYARITGAEGKRQITYTTSDNHSERYDDPEEQVRAEFWAELIFRYEYPAGRVKVEFTIPDRTPKNRADIVVFNDDACKAPYIVVECKPDGVPDATFDQAVEQAAGNATWQILRAAYIAVVAGKTRRFLDVYKFPILERDKNIIADLPKKYGKVPQYKFYKGKDPDIAKISQYDLMTTIKKCHQTLWGGGKRTPTEAFDEFCKIIFVKIEDEKRHRRKGEAYDFQIQTNETPESLAERILTLYAKAQERDPEVFAEPIKIDAREMRSVVSHLESININASDLDAKGVAFEKFMDKLFKGDFGQYFTPRPIVEFVIKMFKPGRDDLVLDTSCGSGGFLLHALDSIRNQAGDIFANHKDDPDEREDYNDYWKKYAEKKLFGVEISQSISRVAKMNMIVHDDGHTNIINFDALDGINKMADINKGFKRGAFHFVLTNPPFGAKVLMSERPYLKDYALSRVIDLKGNINENGRQNSEILFIERIHEFLKPRVGKAAIVLPDGILTNSSQQYVRDFILDKFQLLAVVSLPQAAFAHFGAGVKASIIFVRKRGDVETPSDDEAIFMAAPEEIGYDATGRSNDRSQLPEVVRQWEAFQADSKSFFA